MKSPGGNSAALGLVVLGVLALAAHGFARYGIDHLERGSSGPHVFKSAAASSGQGSGGWEGLLFSRKLDANAATEEDWRSLPFVGKRTASSIVSTRERLGGFDSYEQFLQVSGIGPKRFERLRAWVEIRTAEVR